MNRFMKKAAVAALAGALCVSSLAACGKKDEEVKVEPADVVATIDGEEIKAGVLGFMAKYQQMQTEAIYQQMMGSSASDMWDDVVDEEEGTTYGQQTVDETLTQLETMYAIRAHAEEYQVSLTDEEIKKAQDAAKAFVEANTEETLAAMNTDEASIEELLELMAYQTKMHDPIIADVDKEVSDEEAQQTSYTYTRVDITDENGEALDDDGKAEKKETAQELLDTMLEDPSQDMGEAAKALDENLSAYSSHYSTNDEESVTTPEEAKELLKDLKDGEMVEEVIESEDGYYVVRLDSVFDEESTESQKDSIISQRESDLYTETTEGWVNDAKIEVKDEVKAGITITSTHLFIGTTTSTEEEAADVEEVEEIPETADSEEEPEELTDEDMESVDEEELGGDMEAAEEPGTEEETPESEEEK